MEMERSKFTCSHNQPKSTRSVLETWRVSGLLPWITILETVDAGCVRCLLQSLFCCGWFAFLGFPRLFCFVCCSGCVVVPCPLAVFSPLRPSTYCAVHVFCLVLLRSASVRCVVHCWSPCEVESFAVVALHRHLCCPCQRCLCEDLNICFSDVITFSPVPFE